MSASSEVVESLLARAKARGARIALPEAEDPRVREAATWLLDRGVATPILVGPTGEDRLDDGIEVVAPGAHPRFEEAVNAYFERRRGKGISLEDARHEALDPLMFAGLMVAVGMADGAVAGSVCPTATTIRAGIRCLGPRAGLKTVSSTFLMILRDGRALTYADCGVVPEPTEDELAEIAVTSASTHRILTEQEPVVAFLSFSTKGSASHPRVDKVRSAVRRTRELAPDLDVDGELQFDAAFVPEVARKKAPESSVAGRANVFIFPDLDAGNIAYKMTQRIGGAEALGPLIQGLAAPYLDLSRGCSVEDIVLVSAIAAVMSAES